MKPRTQKYLHKLINEYLEGEEQGPLVFSGWFVNRARAFSQEASVNDMVKKVLELTEQFYTQTKQGRDDRVIHRSNRSAKDIWRLIKNFRPDVTIFQVMKALYDEQENFSVQICSMIEKRVFYDYKKRYSEMRNPSRVHRHSGEKDEFGLYFCEWKEL